MNKKYLAIAAVAALSIAACGGATVQTESIDIEADEVNVEDTAPEPEPELEAEPAVDDIIVPVAGWDAEAISAATEVCMDSNQAAIEATEIGMVTLDVDYVYAVIADEYADCALAMEDAGTTITDPELGGLWDDTIIATWDLVDWTYGGWPGTEADLMVTLDRQEAVNDGWEALVWWANDNLV